MEKIKKILLKINNEIDFESEDFMADGYLDSFSFMELIGALEEFYQIDIFGEEIEIEKFKNIQAIMDYLNAKGVL